MELTGNLKKQVEKAETKNEKKSLIENAGMLLNDDELEQVAGGQGGSGVFYMYRCTNLITHRDGTVGECNQHFLTNYPYAACTREECKCTDISLRELIQTFDSE